MSKITSEELRNLIEAATPGPWRYEKANASPTTGMHMIAGGGRPGYHAEVRDCGSGGVAANAKLIAHLPDLAAEVLELREAHERQQEMAGKLAVLLRTVSNMIESSMKGFHDKQGRVFIPGQSDLDITPDGGLKLSDVRAALSEWEARK